MKFERVLQPPVEVPEGLLVWCATAGGYSWCITCEPGRPEWTPQEKIAKLVGYLASYRLLDSANAPVPLEGGPWQSFPFAEGACRIKLRELMQ